jgi:uncharacterized protein (TIGR02594 family)
MISRRQMGMAILAAPMIIRAKSGFAQDIQNVIGEDQEFIQLDLPSIASLDGSTKYGYFQPTEAQKLKAAKVLSEAKKGPTPFAIAKDLVDRYYATDPDMISQWPAPQSWNPVVKDFFTATSLRASNDMIDWCAAFVNWCIERNGKTGTNSAASQSFITSGKYKKVTVPQPGDLVVFTCYDKATNKNLGIGHVAFFNSDLGNNRISVIGGNQSADGRSSIICEKFYRTTPFDVKRHVNGVYVPCIYRINSYLEI